MTAGSHNGALSAPATSPIGTSPVDAPPSGRAGEAFRVALAALSLPCVARLYGGPHGEIATYYPGGRVEGVRVDDSRVEVHIVVRVDIASPVEAAEQVRAVVAPLVAPREVDLVIEDVEWPGAGDHGSHPAPADHDGLKGPRGPNGAVGR
jgi:hypothetical protein